MLEKCVPTILELNWNQRLGHKKTNLNICHHMLTSPTQLQNWSFHVVERTRTSKKCQTLKNARAKRAQILFFIVKYANLWGFCCRCRRGCLSSLMFFFVTFGTCICSSNEHLCRALTKNQFSSNCFFIDKMCGSDGKRFIFSVYFERVLNKSISVVLSFHCYFVQEMFLHTTHPSFFIILFLELLRCCSSIILSLNSWF